MAMKDLSSWGPSAAASVLAFFLGGGAALAAEPETDTKAETKAAPAPAESEAKVGGASEVKAEEALPPADEPEWEREKATRRSGLIVGVQGNLGVAMASGYPLDLKKIGRAAHYTETGVGFSASGLVWIGVSLKDWLSFGVGATLDGIVAADDKNGWGYGGVFRLEGFPLWPLGGIGKEIGVTFDAGASSFTVPTQESDRVDFIDGGAASYLGGGVFYEGIRFWRISTGPGVYAGYLWSDTLRHGAISLDWRVTLYAGSVEPEKKRAAAR